MKGALQYLFESLLALATMLLGLIWHLVQIVVAVPLFLLSLYGLFGLLMLVVPGGVKVFEGFLPFPKSETALMLLAYLPMGFTTFFYYAVDKRRAIQNERRRRQGREETHWRVPERQLHLMEFFGGWLGALLAQYALRHKTRKESFQVDFWLVGFFHVALASSALFLQDSWLGTGLVLLLGFIAWSKACQ